MGEIGIEVPPPTEPLDPGITIDTAPPEPAPPTEPVAPAPPTVPRPAPGPPVSTGGMPDLDKVAWILLALAALLLALAWTDLINWASRTLFAALRRSNPPQLAPHKVGQRLTNYLGNATKDIDPDVGRSFTAAGDTVGALGALQVAITTRVLNLARKTTAIERGTHTTRLAQQAIRARVNAQAAAQYAYQQKASALQTQDRLAIQTDKARLDSYITHVTKVIEPELDNLRHRIPPLEHSQTDLWALIKKHEQLFGATAVAAGVATALRSFGSDWIRCDNNRDIGEATCGTHGNFLKKLLSYKWDILHIAELCLLTTAVEKGAGTEIVTAALIGYSEGMNELAKCTGATFAKPLLISAPELPPLTPWAGANQLGELRVMAA